MALLTVANLIKDFGGLRANDDVSFELAAGELLGLIGPNGAGKTTLFNCIAGKYPVNAGRIVFDDEDITALKAHEVARRGLARTFQVYAAAGDLTVRENVMVGCFMRTASRRQARARANAILEDLNLAAAAAHYVSELLRYIPRYSLGALAKNPMFVHPELVEKLIESMRLAGLPE